MSYETSLIRILEDREPKLFGTLMKVEKVVRGLLSYTHGTFPYYTPHDFSHSLNVVENLNWMIPDNVKKQMNDHEIFFLLIAAWMHDWGMIGKPNEDPKGIREIHHLRTEEYFEKMYDKLFLSEHEGRIIGRICRGHTKEDLYDKDFDDVVFGANIKIRIRFLAAILRIADECDITCNRTPEIIYYSLSPTDKAEEEFKKHLSISGVGQLEEKHKIYIFAVARDPKTAETLREVKDKIQRELNIIKGILARFGILFDYVQLKLETRGFVDKPISFEVDKKKLIDLLIGEHLYSRKDIAIRELLQNAIDTCRLRRSMEPDYSPEIYFYRDQDKLIIEDNGCGMDFETAKRYLSLVGSSFYDSEEFEKFIEKATFDPISRFGIGILSCFLIAKGMIIETKTKNMKPCRFIVSNIGEGWRYEDGSRKELGTKIILLLNEDGVNINIAESLLHFAKAVEIPIFIGKDPMEKEAFVPKWDNQMKEVEMFVFGHLSEIPEPSSVFFHQTKSMEIKIFEYDFPISPPRIFLAIQGIFVKAGGIPLDIHERLLMLINLKKNLLDIDISREKIVHNQKLVSFLRELRTVLLSSYAENIFHKLVKQDKFSKLDKTILHHRVLSKCVNSFNVLNPEDQKWLSDFLIEKFEYPVVNEKGMHLTLAKKLFLGTQVEKIYEYHINGSVSYASIEATAIGQLCQKIIGKKERIVLNPGKQQVRRFPTGDERTIFNSTVELLCTQHRIAHEYLALTDIVQKVTINRIKTPLDSLLPSWCTFSKLPNELRGLVLQTKPFIFKKEFREVYFDLLREGENFEKILWLTGEHSLDYVGTHYDEHKKRILDLIISPPEFTIDVSEPIISLLLKHSEKILSDDSLRKLVRLHFRIIILSHMMESGLFFRELLAFLEKIILRGIKEEKKYKPLEERLGETQLIFFYKLSEHCPIWCLTKN